MHHLLRKLLPPRPSPTIQFSKSTTEFHFHNRYHIGDNLLNLKYFLYLSPILKARNITIFYYYDTSWPYNKPETLRAYMDPDVVTLRPLHEKPHNSVELWMGNRINGIHYTNTETYYDLFYKRIVSYLNIVNPSLSTSLWIDEPFLLRIYDTLEPQYKNVDILILNTVGHSGQCDDTSPLTQLARHLSKRFTLVTVDPIAGIPSAHTLSLQQIGAISTHAKYIISSCSGPQIPCYNKYARDHVKKWFFITSGIHFAFNSIRYQHTVMDTRPIQQFFDALSV